MPAFNHLKCDFIVKATGKKNNYFKLNSLSVLTAIRHPIKDYTISVCSVLRSLVPGITSLMGCATLPQVDRELFTDLFPRIVYSHF